MKEKKSIIKTPEAKFAIRCYLYFWAGLTVVVILALLTNFNNTVLKVSSTLISWAPTVVVIRMFKMLFPGQKLKEWIKSRFSTRISIGILAANMIVFCGMAFGALFINIGTDVDRMKIIFSPSNLILTAISVILSGAAGEELGWRGYLQPAIEDRHGGNVIKSALIVGLIWSFWHTPLWFVTMGLPMDLLPMYITGFVIGNISTAVIIAVSYSHCRNLIVPIWIHFCFNYFTNIIMAAFDTSTELAEMIHWMCFVFGFTFIAAICFAVWHIKKQKL